MKKLLLPVICAVLTLGTARAQTVPKHYDGKAFFYPFSTPAEEKTASSSGFLSLGLRLLIGKDKGAWPEFVENNPTFLEQLKTSSSELRTTFVNHSTFLIQWQGVNILTDPIWSERASPFSWIGPKRHRNPGIPMDKLPKIDIVIISHNHYDHMDLPTIEELQKRFAPQFIVPLKNKKHLKDIENIKVQELDWEDKYTYKEGFTITAAPARHFSNRWLNDRNESLYAGYIVSSKGENLFFGGDTGFGGHFEYIKEKFKDIKLAILPIGAFRPTGESTPVHMSPAEAVKASQILKAKYNIGTHFQTFDLFFDGYNDPTKFLQVELAKEENKNLHFITLDFGEGKTWE